MTEPAHWRYTVTDILGETYTWVGSDPSTVGGVFSFSDDGADTDWTLLHCEGDVFVNVAQVVSIKAEGPAEVPPVPLPTPEPAS